MHESHAAIDLALGRSRILAAAAVAGVMLAAVSAFMVPLAVGLPALAVAGGALARVWRLQVVRSARAAVTRLVIEPGRRVRLSQGANPELQEVAWRGSPQVIGAIVVLPLSAGKRCLDVLVAPDAVEPQVYRELRVGVTTGVLMPPSSPGRESSGRLPAAVPGSRD